MFHTKDGWFWERLDDGSVRVTLRDVETGEKHELTPGEWASVVAHVSAHEDPATAYEHAEAVHHATRPPAGALDWIKDLYPYHASLLLRALERDGGEAADLAEAIRAVGFEIIEEHLAEPDPFRRLEPPQDEPAWTDEAVEDDE